MYKGSGAISQSTYSTFAMVIFMAWNVLAVDDHEVALAGIDAILRTSDDCTLVGAFSTVDDACGFLRTQQDARVDIVLLDLRLADNSDPFANVQRLSALDVPVLIFSSLEDPYLARRALQAGSAGVLEKSASAIELNQAIVTICRGDTFANTEWASVIDSDPVLGCADLSPRQLEVLELYASGESAKRVATILGLSAETVQDYINRIRHKYAKTGRPVTTKIDMFRRAQEDGFLPGPLGPIA